MLEASRNIALLHLARVPGETRTLEELTSHYLSMSLGSPFAPIVTAMKAADEADRAEFEAKVATASANRKAAETTEFLRQVQEYADDQASIWSRMEFSDRYEQIDAHVESAFAGDDLYTECEEAINRIVWKAAGGH